MGTNNLKINYLLYIYREREREREEREREQENIWEREIERELCSLVM